MSNPLFWVKINEMKSHLNFHHFLRNQKYIKLSSAAILNDEQRVLCLHTTKSYQNDTRTSCVAIVQTSEFHCFPNVLIFWRELLMSPLLHSWTGQVVQITCYAGR